MNHSDLPVCGPRDRLDDPGRGRRALAVLAGLTLVPGLHRFARAGPEQAASSSGGGRAIERFKEHSWAELQAQLPRPAIVLFSSLHCPTCPEAARKAFEARRRLHAAAPLVIVLTDGEEDLESARIGYQSYATRLMVFDGLAAVLRRQVSPRWRGETPWFALLQRDGTTLMQAGLPAPAQWEAWGRAGSSL